MEYFPLSESCVLSSSFTSPRRCRLSSSACPLRGAYVGLHELAFSISHDLGLLVVLGIPVLELALCVAVCFHVSRLQFPLRRLQLLHSCRPRLLLFYNCPSCSPCLLLYASLVLMRCILFLAIPFTISFCVAVSRIESGFMLAMFSVRNAFPILIIVSSRWHIHVVFVVACVSFFPLLWYFP